jgi:hypothetical protein
MLQRNVQLHDPTHCLMLQSFLADHGCAVTANAKAVVRVELSASADVVGIYKSNIYYQQQGSPEVAGEVCALWNDHKLADDEAILRQNNFIRQRHCIGLQGLAGRRQAIYRTGE